MDFPWYQDKRRTGLVLFSTLPHPNGPNFFFFTQEAHLRNFSDLHAMETRLDLIGLISVTEQGISVTSRMRVILILVPRSPRIASLIIFISKIFSPTQESC